MDYKIVVVDDDAQLRRLTGRFVKKILSGIRSADTITVYEANDGDAGYDLIKDHNPGLVLIDSEMPGPFGYDVCRRIRSELGGDIVVVGMSGNPVYRQDFSDAGADAFIPKPFMLGDMKYTLENVLDR